MWQWHWTIQHDFPSYQFPWLVRNFPCFFLNTLVAKPGPQGWSLVTLQQKTPTGPRHPWSGWSPDTWCRWAKYHWKRSMHLAERWKTPGGPGETEMKHMKQVFMWYITGKCWWTSCDEWHIPVMEQTSRPMISFYASYAWHVARIHQMIMADMTEILFVENEKKNYPLVICYIAIENRHL